MSKLRHLHFTASAELTGLRDKESLSSLKHVASKDSLLNIYIDRFPIVEEFSSLIGFS